MRKSRFLKRLLAGLTLVGMGGTSFQLTGCDQGIRSTVLGGLNGATDTLLLALTNALFQSLNNQGLEDATDGEITGTGG